MLQSNHSKVCLSIPLEIAHLLLHVIFFIKKLQYLTYSRPSIRPFQKSRNRSSRQQSPVHHHPPGVLHHPPPPLDCPTPHSPPFHLYRPSFKNPNNPLLPPRFNASYLFPSASEYPLRHNLALLCPFQPHHPPPNPATAQPRTPNHLPSRLPLSLPPHPLGPLLHPRGPQARPRSRPPDSPLGYCNIQRLPHGSVQPPLAFPCFQHHRYQCARLSLSRLPALMSDLLPFFPYDPPRHPRLHALICLLALAQSNAGRTKLRRISGAGGSRRGDYCGEARGARGAKEFERVGGGGWN